MTKINYFLIGLATISMNAAAFFDTTGFSPFGNGTGHTSQAPWSNNSNWNPISAGEQYSPQNDARNMSRFGARPSTLKNYRQNNAFQQNNAMIATPNQIQPSNWLKETDFSKTLDQIQGSGSKTFFVNEMPVNFNDGYKQMQSQSQNAAQAVRAQMQGQNLSPAAASTPRININK
ncbi:hypothetical protein OAC28_00185 [Candidatus Thioglobus sp.]|nr:hypothetical protein [Candidatus Thioglobus sp.]MDC0888469.1 hypothetical protein [Candidatus Thioglobus sp.]